MEFEKHNYGTYVTFEYSNIQIYTMVNVSSKHKHQSYDGHT